MINGRTELIAHLGYPTETFTAPMIYNPWFASRGINAVVVPMGVWSEDYEAVLRPLFRLSNIRGALVTMPHKATTEAAVAVQVAGSCNAILRRPGGSLYGELFDGIGFVRAAKRKGFRCGLPDHPFDPSRLNGNAFVGDVVLTAQLTPLLKFAARRGRQYLIGTDMLLEQTPAYLEFFGYGTTTADELRATARISY